MVSRADVDGCGCGLPLVQVQVLPAPLRARGHRRPGPHQERHQQHADQRSLPVPWHPLIHWIPGLPWPCVAATNPGGPAPRPAPAPGQPLGQREHGSPAQQEGTVAGRQLLDRCHWSRCRVVVGGPVVGPWRGSGLQVGQVGIGYSLRCPVTSAVLPVVPPLGLQLRQVLNQISHGFSDLLAIHGFQGIH